MKYQETTESSLTVYTHERWTISIGHCDEYKSRPCTARIGGGYTSHTFISDELLQEAGPDWVLRHLLEIATRSLIGDTNRALDWLVGPVARIDSDEAHRLAMELNTQ